MAEWAQTYTCTVCKQQKVSTEKRTICNPCEVEQETRDKFDWWVKQREDQKQAQIDKEIAQENSQYDFTEDDTK